MDERVMQGAIDILAIKMPTTYSDGTYLSDLRLLILKTVMLCSLIARGWPVVFATGKSQRNPRNQSPGCMPTRGAQSFVKGCAVLGVGNDLLHFFRENELLEKYPAIC